MAPAGGKVRGMLMNAPVKKARSDTRARTHTELHRRGVEAPGQALVTAQTNPVRYRMGVARTVSTPVTYKKRLKRVRATVRVTVIWTARLGPYSAHFTAPVTTSNYRARLRMAGGDGTRALRGEEQVGVVRKCCWRTERPTCAAMCKLLFVLGATPWARHVGRVSMLEQKLPPGSWLRRSGLGCSTCCPMACGIAVSRSCCATPVPTRSVVFCCARAASKDPLKAPTTFVWQKTACDNVRQRPRQRKTAATAAATDGDRGRDSDSDSGRQRKTAEDNARQRITTVVTAVTDLGLPTLTPLTSTRVL
jgi:hypothetical protein